YRNQQKRRAIAALVLGLLPPAQEADGKKESICSAFGKIVADLAREIDQPSLELPRIQRRGKLVPKQGFGGETAVKVAAVNVAVERRVALAERILLRQRDDPDRGAIGKPVFKIAHVRAQERDRLLGIGKVE